jgi:hypothetical protein
MLEQLNVHIKTYNLEHKIKCKIYHLYLEISQEIRKKKGYTSSKTFFMSLTNKFIEKLIHLHSEFINALLKFCVKGHK